MQNFQWKEMTMGVCYYPEHWNETLWESDLDRMKKAGISVIRIAEFSWNKVEPEEGRFEFGFFDTFLSLCEKKGMKVIFGTPTATPPAWLTKKYPDALNSNIQGIAYGHGSRRHYNYNSENYRRLAARIVEKEAEHYGSHPAIIGWQIDNELNCETDEFYSAADNAAFRTFLKEKYGILDALNAAWGTAFWNQTYTDWEEVSVLRPAPTSGYNPHQHLDYIRFISDSALSFCKMQADILRKHIKTGDFITTNGMFSNMDNHKMQRESLDIYMFDSYPNFAYSLNKDPRIATDLKDRLWSKYLTEVRSICPHFGIMEQQSGAMGWTTAMESPAPRPGQLRLWAMQSLAHGADMVSFFRWRTCRMGTELYWHGILDYDNRDNRKLAEVQDFYRDMKKLEALCGADNVASFAVLKDYDNEWDRRVDKWHRIVADASEAELFAASQLFHCPYDAVYLTDDSDSGDLSRYPVIIYPHPVIMTQKRADLLRRYVEQGGVLVIGCRSGYKDIYGQAPMMAQPGLLAPLTGSDVVDFTLASPEEGLVHALIAGSDAVIDMPVFTDILEARDGGEVLATYTDSYFAGKAAVVTKQVGKGTAVHFGSTFSRTNLKWLFTYLGIYEPYQHLIDAPEQLELVVREKGGVRYLFVLNYGARRASYTLKKALPEILSGKTHEGRTAIEPYNVTVYILQ